jgi:hypothetical protein
LKAALETFLANTLPDLVRRSITGLVDQAVTRALGQDEAEAQEQDAGASGVAQNDRPPGEAARNEGAAGERDNPGESLDSTLFLNALASSQVDPNPTAAQSPAPNGLHPQEPGPPDSESPGTEPPDVEPPDAEPSDLTTPNKDEGKESRRPRSSRRRRDGNDPSTGGPRGQA